MKFTSILVAATIVGSTQACFLPLLNCFTGKSGSSWGNWGQAGAALVVVPPPSHALPNHNLAKPGSGSWGGSGSWSGGGGQGGVVQPCDTPTPVPEPCDTPTPACEEADCGSSGGGSYSSGGGLVGGILGKKIQFVKGLLGH
ncbi:hypothetical protein Cantr_01132 [Candida viswanathii]|uniref:Uncharacterized protein n=1 Tax=Candida viswanathii TaxID=5486 RepID=A0A367YHS9_9ASCO|nr:hypothetical protein Cantr_01132 [Candida viswanathii]